MYKNDRAKKFHYVKLIPSRFKLNHCVKRDKYASTTKLVFFGNVPEKTTKQQPARKYLEFSYMAE